MAESMAGLKRSCRCAEVTEANVGQEMTLMGWVQKSRNKGGIIFTDLRDRSGIIQIIFEESDCGAESFAKAEKLRSEFTVAVVGTIEKRSGAANPNLKTGTIEMRAKSLRILSESVITILGTVVFRLIWLTTIFRMFTTYDMLMNVYVASWLFTGCSMFVVYFLHMRKIDKLLGAR